MREHESSGGITRRAVLRDGTMLALAVLAAAPGGAGGVAVAVTPGRAAYLSDAELHALRGLVDALIPADVDPGALAAGCAEAIDALLGAFAVLPPRIYAGAPFSDRAGSSVNHFETFLPLDAYEERGWRLRIEGSRGRRELEFNGPVRGWQEIYRDGLAALDAAASGSRFGDLPLPVRELMLQTSRDQAVAALLDVAFPHTYQFMYGAPEYGGNRDLVGWRMTGWQGDVQPRGWTARQVEQLDPPDGERGGDVDATLVAQLLALVPIAGSAEIAHNLLIRSGGSMAALRAELAGIGEHAHGA